MTRPLEITSLSKIFPTPTGPYVAIKDFSVKIEPGEFVCILGHSGCGKSTLLAILAGLQRASLGGVCIDGKEVDTLAGHVDLRRPLAKNLDVVE